MDLDTGKVLLASAGGFLFSVSDVETVLRITLAIASIFYIVSKSFLLWRRRKDNHDDDAD